MKINIGDKFKRPNGIYEVIGLKPGGKVEFIIRESSIFTDKWTRDIKDWEKI